MRASLLTMTIVLITLPAYAKYSGGTGEPNDPYQIATAKDLMLLGDSPEDYDKYLILTGNINLDPNLPDRKVFDRAVIASDRMTPFIGIFDGNGHTISHLTIRGGYYLGLFGQLGSKGKVLNLGLEAVDVDGTGWHVGGLVGSNSGTITTSYSNGVVTGESTVGGLVGGNWSNGYIATSYSSSAVNGNEDVGGLVGSNAGTLTTSYSGGAVTGESTVGGLVGGNWGNGCIATSYSTDAVNGDEYVGGLVGYNDGSITTSYSSGKVDGTGTYVGGLVGAWAIWPFIVNACIWDTEASGLSRSAGGVGLTTAEMMDTYMLGLNGFADDPNWVLDVGRDYPRLAWEGTAGSMVPKPDIDWLNGSGTAETPYRVDKAEQLILLGKAPIIWNKHFILSADVDLDPALPGRRVFAQPPIQDFTGVFDGDGHTISHLTITGRDNLGLFGWLESGAEVRDLGVVDVNITGDGWGIGGLVGNNDGVVNHCYSTGAVSGKNSVGGLVGYTRGCVVNCHSSGTVSGDDDVGGMVGDNYESAVTCCYSTSSVTGSSNVGGLVGFNFRGNLIHCYSTGSVTGGTRVGGLVGQNIAEIAACYTAGIVSGESDVGGLVGSMTKRLGRKGTLMVGNAKDCFWDIEATSRINMCGSGYGDAPTCNDAYGKTTAEMQTASTFLEAGWDFAGETANGTEDIWRILEGQDYPRLWWEAAEP